MSAPAQRTGVVVIGAGFTGLSAALALKHAGVDFVLLEAQNRVGGRVEARLNGLGERVDTGGQFLCDDMPELMVLVKAHGKQLIGTRFEGNPVVQPPAPLDDIERGYAASMAIRDRLNAVLPDDASIAGLTVADWLARQPDSTMAKVGFRSMIEGLWCLALEELPAWYLVSNDRRVTNEAPELQYFVAETMHALAEDLAYDIGDRLLLDTAAARIEHGPAGVRVTTMPAEPSSDAENASEGEIFEARAALVCVPPATAAKLDFSPGLPAPVREALDVWRSGAVVKFFLRYRKAFWRDRGLSGTVMWRDPAGLFAFDASPDDAHPMLGFFVGGPIALKIAGLAETGMKAKAVAWLAAALGQEAGEPIDVMMRNWTHDRWSGGAYSDLVVDLAATGAEDVLRAGAAPVLFACSELSPSYPGYIEGAIVAGREGARRTIEALDR